MQNEFYGMNESKNNSRIVITEIKKKKKKTICLIQTLGIEIIKMWHKDTHTGARMRAFTHRNST